MDLWNDLKMFYLVTENKSFTKTAKFLQLNVATISRRMSFLEKKLETSLFEQRPRKLSKSGTVLKKYINSNCFNILEDENTLKQILKERNSIKIFTTDEGFLYFLKRKKIYNKLLEIFHVEELKVVDLCFVSKLINENKNDFIYISPNINFLNRIQNKNYLYWPIDSFSLNFIGNKGDVFFIKYEGLENWLVELHENYMKKKQIKSDWVIRGSSLEVVKNLVKSKGYTISIEGEKDFCQENCGSFYSENLLFFLCSSNMVFLKFFF